MTSETKFEIVDTTPQPLAKTEGVTMTSTAKWIDEQPGYAVGNAGFLIEVYNENTAGTRFSLDDSPPYTNRSNEPRLISFNRGYIAFSCHGC